MDQEKTITYREAETAIDIVEAIEMEELSDDSRKAVEIVLDAAKAFENKHRRRAEERGLSYKDGYWDTVEDYYGCLDEAVTELRDRHHVTS